MTVKVELKPEVAASLHAQAAARGISVEEYVRQVIEDQAGVQPARKATPEEIEAMLDELAEMGKDLPHLPSSAFTRDSIYQDHD